MLHLIRDVILNRTA